MYAIYAYIGVALGVNVGISYGIHGVSGDDHCKGCTFFDMLARKRVARSKDHVFGGKEL